MKKYITLLMIFTAIFCYSQDKHDGAVKKVPKNIKNVSIEQFEMLKDTVNSLVTSNKKLKAEKDALEEEFNKRGLTTEQIAEKAQAFYSNAFYSLLAIITILLAIWGGMHICQKGRLKSKKQKSATDIEPLSSLSTQKSAGDSQAIESPKPSQKTEDENSKAEANTEHWFSKAHKEILAKNIEGAKKVFKEYALEEEDQEKLAKENAFFLFLLYNEGRDHSALGELEKLVDSCSSEDAKFEALRWFAACLEQNSQINVVVTLWRDAIESFNSAKLKTDSIIKLAETLDNDSRAEEAKQLLISRLNIVDTNSEKAKIFESLSLIEKSLNNPQLAVFCKDKSIELDFNDGDTLFDSAFMASENKINEITLANYTSLLKIDRNNAGVLNNLGVCASENNLKTIAVENYKKSSQFDMTLAMANQGFLLLENGFVAEAKELAEKALKLKDPDQSVYRLLTSIHEKQKKEKKEWEEIISKAKDRQKFLRKYTEAYYFNNTLSFKGKWKISNKDFVMIDTLDVSESKLTWQESGALSKDIYNIEISAEFTNSSFKGTYVKIKEGQGSTLLGDTRIKCLGFLSQDGTTINIIAEDSQNPFALTLTKD